MMAIIRLARNLSVLACFFSVVAARGADLQLAYASTTKSPEIFLKDGVRIFRDVIYGTNDGVALKMDIRMPLSAVSNAAPAVIRIHGGSWSAGDKASGGCVPATLQQLLKRGYVTASINYRLAPKHRFPAQIEDAKCAIRYLRAHARYYGIDPSRIGVWGESAGGHLAALVGLADASAGWDADGGWPAESSRVQAVADLFGPTDLARAAQYGDPFVGKAVFGVTNATDPRLELYSPVNYVSKDAPPFLILQGDRDKIVHPSQSAELQEKLTEAGAMSTLVVVTNAGHGFGAVGGKPSPGLAQIAQIIADFFDRTLKKQARAVVSQ